MKKTSLLYLSGPITGCSYADCIDWRKRVVRALPKWIEVISPLRDRHDVKDKKNIRDRYEGNVLASPEAIVEQNLLDVTTCDAMLVNLLGATRISIGTVAEIAWAKILKKPIVLIMEPKGSLHDHSIVLGCTPFRVATLEHGIELTITLLRTGL